MTTEESSALLDEITTRYRRRSNIYEIQSITRQYEGEIPADEDPADYLPYNVIKGAILA